MSPAEATQPAASPSGVRTPPAPAGSPDKALWLPEKLAPEAAAIDTKRVRYRFLCVLLLAMSGTSVGIFSWLGPSKGPLFFAIIVTEQTDPGIMPVSFGFENKKTLTSGNSFTRVQAVPDSSPDRVGILTILENMVTMKPSARAVLYLSARSAVAPDGSVLVLPTDASLTNEGSRGTTIQNSITLSEIFKKVGDCPARQKLVILDIFQPISNIPGGLISPDIAERSLAEYEAYRQKIDADSPGQFNLLLPCLPGQYSLTNQVLRGSIFCHFLVAALSGELVPPPDCTEALRGRMVLSELCRIIGPHIDRWAAENNLERQYPMMVGPENRFLLAVHNSFQENKTEEEPEASDETATEVPPIIRECWQLLQEQGQRPGHIENPRNQSKLFFLALNATLEYLIGSDPATYGPKVAFELTRIKQAEAEAEKRMIEPGVRPTLGMLIEDNLLADSSAVGADVSAMLKAFDATPVKPAEEVQTMVRLAGEFLKAHPGLSDAVMEDAVVRTAMQYTGLRQNHLVLLVEIATLHHKSMITAEGLLLQNFALAAVQPVFDSELVRTTLSTNLAVNQCMAKWLIFAWGSALMEEMAEYCLEATWLSLNSATQHRSEALRLFDKAASLSSFLNGFHQVSSSVRKALWLSILDMSVLQSYPIALPSGWQNYSLNCQAIFSLLKQYPMGISLSYARADEAARKMRGEMHNLQQSYFNIHQPVTPEGIQEFANLIKAGRLSPATMIEISAVARLSGIPTDDRINLLKMRDTLVRKIANDLLETERTELRDNVVAMPRSPFDPNDTSRSNWRKSFEIERINLARQMIVMSGISGPTLNKFDLLTDSIVLGGQSKGTAWGELGALLRRIYIHEIPDNLQKNPQQSLLLNLLYPGWIELPLLDNPDKNPLALMRNKNRISHLAWLVSRFRHTSRVGIDSDFWIRSSSQVSGNFNSRFLTGIRVAQPAPLRPPEIGHPVVAEFTWNVEGLENIDPVATIIGADNPSLIATLLKPASRTGTADGTTRVQIERDPKLASQFLTSPTHIVVELRVGTRAWLALIVVQSDSGADTPFLLVGESPDDKKLLADNLNFRGSNSKRRLFPQLRSPSAKPSTISVSMRADGEQEISLGPVNLTIAPGAMVPLPLTTLMGIAVDPKSPDAAAPPAATAAVTESASVSIPLPSQLIFEIRDLGQPLAPPLTRRLNLNRIDPSEIVEIVTATSEPERREAKDKIPGSLLCKLRIGLRAKRPPLDSPPCRVELLLDKAPASSGVRLGSGNTAGVLPTDGSVLYLEANGISAGSSTTGIGEFTLTIDGYPMVYRFKADLEPQTRQESAELVREPSLGVKAAFIPTKADPLGKSPTIDSFIRIQAWASLAPGGSRLRVSMLGGPDLKNKEQIEILPSGLKSRLRIRAHESGGWDFSCEESTWSIDWGAEGLKGSKIIQLELLSKDNKVLKTATTPLLVDPTPIRFAEIVGLPSLVAPGGSYAFIAVVDEPESGIQTVTLFPGAPVANPDGSQGPPPGLIPFPATFKGNLISGTLTVPADAKLPFAFTLQATNGAGQVTTFSQTLPLGGTAPPADPVIFGVVTEGDRPQAGLAVNLLDPKGMQVATAKTDEKGQYRLEQLKKGPFTVEVTKKSSGRSARKPVTLIPGPPLELDLKLLE
ncbi:MAG: carboxypeptidase regulatory-like domain-containing protein [Planctomycetota bacterium]|nr:MAG: carboxypeptidase regulatory-like domain-containing protein [Planctomycetota bacterium]